MAVIPRNRQNNNGTSVSSVTISSYDTTSAVRPDKVLVVSVAAEDADTASTVSDVTFNAVSLTKAVGISHGAGGNNVLAEIWYSTSFSGTADIVATFSGTTDRIDVQAFVLDGAKAQAPEATTSGTDATSPIGPLTITTVTDGAFIFDLVGIDTTSTLTVSESGQETTDNWFFGQAENSRQQGGDAGNHTMGWTVSGFALSAHVVTAWEDAGAWVSNFVSALTQGNEDFGFVGGAAQISTVTTPLPSADWSRVFQFAKNATNAQLTHWIYADNQTEPTSNHIIVGFLVRWASVGPTNNNDFFSIMNDGNDDPGSTTDKYLSLRLETDGDIALRDANETIQATATTPVSADTWYLFEVRFLPSSSAGECQVWYKEFGTGSFTDLFGGNQTGLTLGTFAQMNGAAYQGQFGGANDDTMYFAGAYCMINSTAASDRLDSDFEVIGPYQDTAITGQTPDNGSDLSNSTAGWENTQEIPFSDEGGNDRAGYVNSGELGSIHFDGGSRPGPASDSRVDGDSNLKAWKLLWRGSRGNGGGSTHTLYIGDDSGTWSSGFDSLDITLNTSQNNFYFVTDDSTNMPTSTDNFSCGFGFTGGREIYCNGDMAAFVLHVPATGAARKPGRLPLLGVGHGVDR